MEADANMRELLGLTKGTTSEECYRIWRDNIPSEYTEKVDNCVKKLWKKDMLTSSDSWKNLNPMWRSAAERL